MCLSACATAPAPSGTNWADVARQVKAETRTSFAPACPTPSSQAALRQIQGELVAALAAKAPPDTLATEWERLDAAARACRRGRA